MIIKKVTFVVDKFQQQDRIFDPSKFNPVNRDGGVIPFFLFKSKLAEYDVQISTQDIFPPEHSDLLLFLDIPKDFSNYPKNKLKYLIITESELIKPHNWDLSLHLQFDKIFTWNDDFVDNLKYFKLNFSNQIFSTAPESGIRNKFCCLIAGAKSNGHPFELYSKRVEVIRWFEANAPKKFDLYGTGWDLYQFKGPVFLRALNRFKFLRQLFADKYPAYKGSISSKKDVLMQYQFSICYENAERIPGYVTEKLFDSMFWGCIPVYWGAPNILSFVPANCFIDKRKFNTYEDLFLFLQSLTPAQIAEYQAHIFNFLNSKAIYPYSAESFAESLVQQIVVGRNIS